MLTKIVKNNEKNRYENINVGGATMARIAGVDLPNEKRAEIGLTYIYGIGRATANEILAKAEINPDTRIKDLSEEEVNTLRRIIDNDFLVEGDLRREIALNIKRLRDIKCYRGIRHAKGLPLRGQKDRREIEKWLNQKRKQHV